MRRNIIAIIALQAIAIILAMFQWNIGLRTDEAKYFLNIPYPHPPLVRWILHATDVVSWHEIFWRVLFATAMIQAAWLIWHALRSMSRMSRFVVCASWLVSSAVILQAGTIMMAPLTALFGLAFVCLSALRADAAIFPACRSGRESPLRVGKMLTDWHMFLIGILWLCSLFTAYQGILYAPLVLALLLRSSAKRWQVSIYVFAPIALLALYSLTNPLAIASMGLSASKDQGLPFLARISGALWLWLVSGTGVVSVLGTAGILLSRRWELLLTFLLVFAFVAFSNHDYYMVLFTPLFIVGIAEICLKYLRNVFEEMHVVNVFQLILLIPLLIVSVLGMGEFPSGKNIARDTVAAIVRELPPESPQMQAHRSLLIVGPFGHEWQYYSPFAVVRYSPTLADHSKDILVCLEQCPSKLLAGMRPISAPLPTWLKTGLIGCSTPCTTPRTSAHPP